MKFLSLLFCVAILVLLSGCGRPPTQRGTSLGSQGTFRGATNRGATNWDRSGTYRFRSTHPNRPSDL
jgi:hypothetical protein